MSEQPNNPLHGVRLETIMESLVDRHGFDGLADRIPVNCFRDDPCIPSSLKFLRKTPWARAKIERLYLADLRQLERNKARNARRAARRAYKASVEAGEAPKEA